MFGASQAKNLDVNRKTDIKMMSIHAFIHETGVAVVSIGMPAPVGAVYPARKGLLTRTTPPLEIRTLPAIAPEQAGV